MRREQGSPDERSDIRVSFFCSRISLRSCRLRADDSSDEILDCFVACAPRNDGSGAIFRHCERSEAIQIAIDEHFGRPFIGRAFARSRWHVAMTCVHFLAAQTHPSYRSQPCPSKQRAQGTPGVRCTRSLACKTKKHTSIVTTGSPVSTGVPRANGFNGLFRALPGDRAFLPPSSPRSLLLKNLTPASGRQDHTALPSASGALVSRAARVHRIPYQRP